VLLERARFMITKPLELFYSYARENEALRDQLNQHLKILKRQGFIREWHDRNISAGNEGAQQIDEHLQKEISSRAHNYIPFRDFVLGR
jgi:hypothetical protein